MVKCSFGPLGSFVEELLRGLRGEVVDGVSDLVGFYALLAFVRGKGIGGVEMFASTGED